MHCTKTKTVIGAKKSVYRDFPVGKLEKCSLVRTMHIPHQQGFNCDSKACLPIAIDFLPTLTFVEGIVGAMSFANSTAVAAPFGGVVSINNVEFSGFIKTSVCEVSFKQVERNTQYFLVEPSAFWFESLQFFNSNIRLVLQGEVGNIPDDFSNPIFYEVPLGNIEFQEFLGGFMASLIGETLKEAPSFHDFIPFNPNVFSKVKLFQNLSFRRKNAHRKALAININSKHVSFCGRVAFFGEVGDYLSIGGKPVCFALPAVLDESCVSLVVPVLPDWDCDSFSGVNSEFNKEISFCVESFAVSGDIEFNGNPFKSITFGFDNCPFNITDNLTIERGEFFAG